MSTSQNVSAPKPVSNPDNRYRKLSPFWAVVVVALGSLSILLALNQILNAGFLIGETMLDSTYLYVLAALLIGVVFLLIPATEHSSKTQVPCYDAVCFLLTMAVFFYFSMNTNRIISEAWEFMAPTQAIVVAGLGWVLLLEATRRAGGTAVFFVVLFISLYPVFADKMPGPMQGSRRHWKPQRDTTSPAVKASWVFP